MKKVLSNLEKPTVKKPKPKLRTSPLVGPAEKKIFGVMNWPGM